MYLKKILAFFYILYYRKLYILYSIYPLIMTQNAIMTSLYLQKDLVPKIDVAMKQFPDIFRSRNALINASIVRELRRLGIMPREE